ncbi:2Fe-2S iron-sulfur cluster-binding protein, partial [Achromobacter xylosoxidans]
MSTPAHAIILEHGRFTSDGSTSILEAALAQGVAVPFSCQRGECGSCRAQVAGGAYARIAPPTER